MSSFLLPSIKNKGLVVVVVLTIYRQLLFCRVTLGKSFLQFSAMKMAHSPPGHHSVTGRPSVNGLALAEYVIYRGEQVVYFWFVFPNISLFLKFWKLVHSLFSWGFLALSFYEEVRFSRLKKNSLLPQSQCFSHSSLLIEQLLFLLCNSFAICSWKSERITHLTSLSGLSWIFDYIPDCEAWSHRRSIKPQMSGKEMKVKSVLNCWKNVSHPTGIVVENVNKI